MKRNLHATEIRVLDLGCGENQSWTGFHRIRGHGLSGSAFDHPRSSSKLARHLAPNRKRGGIDRCPSFPTERDGNQLFGVWQILQKLDPCQCLNCYNAPASQTSEERLRETHCGGTNPMLRGLPPLLEGRFEVNHLHQSKPVVRIYVTTIKIVVRSNSYILSVLFNRRELSD